MALGKILKWLAAPKPGADRKTVHSSGEYGRKNIGRTWYKIDGTLPIKFIGEPDYSIVGESHFQSPLRNIVGGEYDLGVFWNVVAQLRLIEDNPHDGNAVGIYISDHLVGYIPANDAARVRRELKAANPNELPVICKAMICGGFMDGGERASYGVKIGLRFPIEEQPQPKNSKRPAVSGQQT